MLESKSVFANSTAEIAKGAFGAIALVNDSRLINYHQLLNNLGEHQKVWGTPIFLVGLGDNRANRRST